LAFDAPELNFSTPWFEPWQPWAGPVLAYWRQTGSVHQALQQHQLQNVTSTRRFVDQSALPPDQAYEAFIHATSQIPTRNNLHDFFNGCCWLRFPLTKARLNFLQAAEINRLGIGSVRGPVRDALTLFDENVALIQAPDMLWNALSQRNWTDVGVTLRSHWQDVHLKLFGHALLEKMVNPYQAITAHLFRIPSQLDPLDSTWDAWLSKHLRPENLLHKPFQPLPVMGIPGWSANNQSPDFYKNQRVFRS
jgi:hypothetical protein